MKEKITLIIVDLQYDFYSQSGTLCVSGGTEAANKIKDLILKNSDNIKLGNYLNVKESLSALYIICRFLYKTSYSKEPIPKSNLFQMNNWLVYTELGNGFLQVADEHGLSFYAN